MHFVARRKLVVSLSTGLMCLSSCGTVPDVPTNAPFFYHSAIAAGDYRKAYDRLCAELQAKATFDEFVETDGRAVYPFVSGYWEGEDDRVPFSGKIRMMVLPSHPSAAEGQRPPKIEVTVRVVRERGKWRMCTLVT